MTNPIRIGIIGGGLAGITLAIALLKHPHLDVHVYESGSTFKERGAGIGLFPIALEALDDIIPGAVDLLRSQAGAVDADLFVVATGMRGPNKPSLSVYI